MKTIAIVCGAGMSSSLLVNKIKEAAAKEGKDYEVFHSESSNVQYKCQNADCILVGPQTRFDIPKFQKLLPGVPVDVIDMRAYGTMNGKAVLEHAEKLMGIKSDK